MSSQPLVCLEAATPTEPDCLLVMEWRNDPLTLSMSFHQAPKEWKQFWPEYRDTYFATPPLTPVFAVVAKERVGFLRFRPLEDGVCDLSINVAPEHRGKGLATPILVAAADHLKSLNMRRVVAEVKLENQVSRRIFTSAGYELADTLIKEVKDSGDQVPIYHFVKLLT